MNGYIKKGQVLVQGFLLNTAFLYGSLVIYIVFVLNLIYFDVKQREKGKFRWNFPSFKHDFSAGKNVILVEKIRSSQLQQEQRFRASRWLVNATEWPKTVWLFRFDMRNQPPFIPRRPPEKT